MPRRRKQKSLPTVPFKHQFICLVLLVPVVFLGYEGVQRIAASITDYQTRLWLEHWSERRQKDPAFVISERDFEIASSGAERALAIVPEDGELSTRLATVYDWYVMQGVPGTERYQNVQGAAIERFRQASELRPLWPESWFNLAYAKGRQGHFDQEFDSALNKAFGFGPWEERMQINAARITLAIEGRVSGSSRQLLEENIARTAAHQPAELLKMAKEYPVGLDRVCPYFLDGLPKACAEREIKGQL